MLCCNVLEQQILFAPVADIGITPHLAHSGFWESWVSLSLSKHIKPGHVCVDVGANCGYYSLAMKQLCGDSGTIIGYEPNRETWQCLHLTYRVNGIPQLNAKPFAVGNPEEQRESSTLSVIPDDLGVSTNFRENLPGNSFDQRCELVSIDDDLGERKIDFLKIDAEGSDCNVICGASATLRKWPDCVVLFEHCSEFFSSTEQEHDSLELAIFFLQEGNRDLFEITPESTERRIGTAEILSNRGKVWNLISHRKEYRG